MIDVTNKRFCIFGMQGGGKSVLLKHILRSTTDHVVYDPLREHQGFNRYLPTNRNSVAEASLFITDYVLKRRPKLFVVDEGNRYVRPKPSPLPLGFAELNDYSRHWEIAWGTCTRRPSQFHSDIVELCHFLFIFHLPGPKDRRFLNEVSGGLGDIVRELPQYHFAVLDQTTNTISTHAPLDMD